MIKPQPITSDIGEVMQMRRKIKMPNLENIRDIFSILHDGVISAWTGNKDLLTLTVECEYLAERIDKSFDKFYVELSVIDKIELDPWSNPFDIPAIIKTELSDIFKAELEILSADIKDDVVVVVCNQHNTEFDYCGGNLIISCQSIKIFDQSKNELTIEQFNKICKEYWDTSRAVLESPDKFDMFTGECMKKKRFTPPYGLGFLGFIPLVGFFVGIGLTLYGIIKYKDKKLIIIGIACMIFSVIVYSSLFYVGLKSDFGKKGRAIHAQMQLNTLVKHIEYYKLEHGVYPDSLQQLMNTNEFIFLIDPTQSIGTYYSYKNCGDKYLLFSAGIDRIPNTEDDIFPEINPSNENIGWIRNPYTNCY